jgi:hypothetical protein
LIPSLAFYFWDSYHFTFGFSRGQQFFFSASFLLTGPIILGNSWALSRALKKLISSSEMAFPGEGIFPLANPWGL